MSFGLRLSPGAVFACRSSGSGIRVGFGLRCCLGSAAVCRASFVLEITICVIVLSKAIMVVMVRLPGPATVTQVSSRGNGQARSKARFGPKADKQ